MRSIYYLVSSLPELTLDTKKIDITIDEFLTLCNENLTEKEFKEIKKIFIFNDIKNAVFYKEKEFSYYFPSFYTEEEFKDNLKDSDSFYPFLAEYFYNQRTEKRLYPKMLESDELVLLFYQYIDNFVKGFVKDYFLFELDLQNSVTALYLRANQIQDPNKIIQFTDESVNFIKSNSPDFGLSGYLDYITKLVELFKDKDLVKIEKSIEAIKWQWLKENGEKREFSLEFVISYAAKLISVERWRGLTESRGEKVFNDLIDKISTVVNI